MAASFSREDLHAAVAELARRLAARGVRAGIRIVGGAALSLSYYDRAATHDIDAVIHPAAAIDDVLLETVAMAHERGWNTDWLNDAVKAYLPFAGDPSWHELIHIDEVHISVAPADLLLAMKRHAARGARDNTDIRPLLVLCEIASADDAEGLDEAYYPGEALKPRAQAELDRFFEAPAR